MNVRTRCSSSTSSSRGAAIMLNTLIFCLAFSVSMADSTVDGAATKLRRTRARDRLPPITMNDFMNGFSNGDASIGGAAYGDSSAMNVETENNNVGQNHNPNHSSSSKPSKPESSRPPSSATTEEFVEGNNQVTSVTVQTHSGGSASAGSGNSGMSVAGMGGGGAMGGGVGSGSANSMGFGTGGGFVGSNDPTIPNNNAALEESFGTNFGTDFGHNGGGYGIAGTNHNSNHGNHGNNANNANKYSHQPTYGLFGRDGEAQQIPGSSAASSLQWQLFLGICTFCVLPFFLH